MVREKLLHRKSALAGKRTRSWFSLVFPALAVCCSLAVMGILLRFGFTMLEGVVALCIFALLLILQQDAIVATLVLIVQVYVDWYIGYRIVSIGMAAFLLLFFYLARSRSRPWGEPLKLGLWATFLGLAIFPAIRGALNNHDFLVYYPDIFLGAFLMFWLGTTLARDTQHLYRLFQCIAVLGAFLALHTILEATTGTFLFALAREQAYVAGFSNFQLGVDLNVHRAESFLIDPNWNGTFLVLIFFVPLGLFIASSSLIEKLLYLGAMLIILPALLFTYSTSAWLALLIGIGVCILFAGNMRVRLQLFAFMAIAALIMLAVFYPQITLLLQHATDPQEISLRNAVWQTALRVIMAYPLTGVGLGHEAYLETAEKYRVPAQIVPLDHPHNSYLELGAMGGLPVLFIFLVLVLAHWWQTLCHWRRVDAKTQALLGAGLAATVALCINSWGNQGWTLPPLAGLAWLIMGAISSPLLVKQSTHLTKGPEHAG